SISTRDRNEAARRSGIAETCHHPVGLPNNWSDCRCAYCIAGMSIHALLTKRSKTILALSLVKPLRILLPRTRFLRHRIGTESSSLGSGPTAWHKSSSLVPRPTLSIWLRPYHQAPTSVGASFFCASFSPANLHGSTSDCAFVIGGPAKDSVPNSGVRGAASLQGQRPRPTTSGPAPPLGRGFFLCLLYPARR